MTEPAPPKAFQSPPQPVVHHQAQPASTAAQPALIIQPTLRAGVIHKPDLVRQASESVSSPLSLDSSSMALQDRSDVSSINTEDSYSDKVRNVTDISVNINGMKVLF